MNRIYLSQNGHDGFGFVMDIHLKNGDKIGSMVLRKKTYLQHKGYPIVCEIHIGFEQEYQRMGFFQDALIELYDSIEMPIYISSGRVINIDVFRAISKLDPFLLVVKKIDTGFIITKK